MDSTNYEDVYPYPTVCFDQHDFGRALQHVQLRADQEPDFITGQPPSLLNPPTGCRFKDRCPSRFDRCDEEPPMFGSHRRKVKCWLYAQS